MNAAFQQIAMRAALGGGVDQPGDDPPVIVQRLVLKPHDHAANRCVALG